MSAVRSRNGARPPDNQRPFISFLDVQIAQENVHGLYRACAFCTVSPKGLREATLRATDSHSFAFWFLLAWSKEISSKAKETQRARMKERIWSFIAFIVRKGNSKSLREDRCPGIDSRFSSPGRRLAQSLAFYYLSFSSLDEHLFSSILFYSRRGIRNLISPDNSSSFIIIEVFFSQR